MGSIGSGVKAMPGSIPTPNSGSLYKNKKIQVAKWGIPKKYLKKHHVRSIFGPFLKLKSALRKLVNK